MCETSFESSENREGRKESGIILGYWDQEKTLAVIKGLEDSINVVENKCTKLMQQLLYYEHHWEELNKTESLTVLPQFQKSKPKNKNSTRLESNSVPNIVRIKEVKELHDFEEWFQQVFEKKLLNIHKQLSAAASTIGMKDSFVLFPTDDYVNLMKENAEGNVEKLWFEIKKEFVKTYCNGKVKSDSKLDKLQGEDSEAGFSKITRNEWNFYRKLSKMQLSRKKCKKTLRKKATSYFKKNVKKLSTKKAKLKETQEQMKTDVCIRKPQSKKSSLKSLSNTTKRNIGQPNQMNRKKSFDSQVLLKRSISSITKECAEGQQILESDLLMICKELLSEITTRNPLKKCEEIQSRGCSTYNSSNKKFLPKLESFAAGNYLRKNYKVEPKICEPASESTKVNSRNPFNSVDSNFKPSKNGLNTMVTKSELPNLNESKIRKANGISAQYMTTTYPWNHQDREKSFELDDQNIESNRTDHKKSIWIPDAESTTVERKLRSRYTKTSADNFVKYHQSTFKHFVNGQQSMIKTESKTAYALGSNVLVSNCKRTDFYDIKNCSNASGDNNENHCKLKKEWTRVLMLFSDLCSKYATLKEATTRNELPSDTAVKILEAEIEKALEKYKHFLIFYSKFLDLKHQLKAIKNVCLIESIRQESTCFFPNYQKKNSSNNLTQSMVAKKALKQIQDLQYEIKNICDR